MDQRVGPECLTRVFDQRLCPARLVPLLTAVRMLQSLVGPVRLTRRFDQCAVTLFKISSEAEYGLTL